jgi:hypothetical protein
MGPLPPSPVIFDKTSNLNLGKQQGKSEINYENFQHVPLNQVCLIFKGLRTKGGAFNVKTFKKNRTKVHGVHDTA